MYCTTAQYIWCDLYAKKRLIFLFITMCIQIQVSYSTLHRWSHSSLIFFLAKLLSLASETKMDTGTMTRTMTPYLKRTE